MRVLLITGMALCLIACQSHPRPEQRTATQTAQQEAGKKYELRGTVVAVLKDKRELRVKHQDIPGYMHAMTMNFPLRDDAALAGLAPGDEITAELNVAAPGDYWLANIRKTAPLKPAP